MQLEQGSYSVYQGEGCTECRGTGYKGRSGIFEVLDFTDNIKSVLSDNADLNSIYDAAKNDGMINLRQVAIRKMLEGVTTYEEVIAVTG